MYRQEPPNCIQVEATEGCNLRCTFCGLNGIRGPNTRTTDRYLTVENAQVLAWRIAQAGWTPRIEFAMHGEPTLNPRLPEILGAFRQQLPRLQLMLTTNGVPLQQHPDGFDAIVDRLFAAGLNILTLDNYRGLRVAPLARAYAAARGIPQYEYPDEKPGNPHVRRQPGSRVITVVRDISEAREGNHAHLSNHAGAGAALNERAQGKRCALPFRELSIRWDGSIALCCNDWRGIFKVGNALHQPLEAIWHSPAMYAARKHLLRGERTFGPCRGCDHTSFRPGLLPDKRGQRTLPPADDQDDRLIELACAGPSLTRPVLRPWEREGATNLRVLQ